MNSLQRLLSNTVLAFFSNVVTRASNSLLFIFIGRELGAAAGGSFNLGITYFAIIFGLSAWGLHELMVRELAPRREMSRPVFANYLFLRLLLAAGTYGLLLIALLLFVPYSAETRMVIFILALAVFPEAFFSICQAFFEAHEQLLAPALAAGANGLFKLVVGIWLVFQGASVTAIAWVVPAGSLLGLLLFLPFLIGAFRRHPAPLPSRPRWSTLGRVLRETPSFFVIHIFSLLDYQTDALLISLLLSETHVGWYGAAQTLLLAFWTLPYAIRAALYPVMTRYYQAESAQLPVLYEEASRFLLIAILPMAAGVSLLARPLVQLIFTTAFDPAIPALQWSIWAVVFGVVTVPSARVLIIANRQREAAWITGISMGANVAGNLLLIPLLGIAGAAIARLLASLLFAALIYAAVQRLVLKRGLLHLFPVPLLATAGMALAVWQLAAWGLWWQIPAGIIVYGVAIFALGGLSTRDFNYLRRLVWWRKLEL